MEIIEMVKDLREGCFEFQYAPFGIWYCEITRRECPYGSGKERAENCPFMPNDLLRAHRDALDYAENVLKHIIVEIGNRRELPDS